MKGWVGVETCLVVDECERLGGGGDADDGRCM